MGPVEKKNIKERMFKILKYVSILTMISCDQISFNRLRNNIVRHAGVPRRVDRTIPFRQQITQWVIARNDLTNVEKVAFLEKMYKNHGRRKKSVARAEPPKPNMRLQKYL